MKPIVKIGGALIAVAMLCIVLLNPSSCNKPPVVEPNNPPPTKECMVRAMNGVVESGQDITFEMRNTSPKEVLDSLLYLDGQPIEVAPISTIDMPLGKHSLKAKYLFTDSTRCESSWSVMIRSDIEPEFLSFEMLDMFDHDATAYTQGLVWHDGRLYEGTGQYGESIIHNYNPKLLDYADRIELPMTFFGEGITILGDKLYQLTWKAGIGKVYDLETMKELKEFSTPMQEGWGLTDDGINLIMSDGSNMLHYMDPNTFEITRTQEVYNNKGPELALNELEYVNGHIYANIYGQDALVKIDAASGKTVAYIDCRGILPPEFHTASQDVFNGIAYDPQRQTFFVTGKYWNKMFEVRFTQPPA